jgi:hypothetical protein
MLMVVLRRQRVSLSGDNLFATGMTPVNPGPICCCARTIKIVELPERFMIQKS